MLAHLPRTTHVSTRARNSCPGSQKEKDHVHAQPQGRTGPGLYEGFYAPGAGPPKRVLPQESVDAFVDVSEADRTPKREAPTPVNGFGATGGWGSW